MPLLGSSNQLHAELLNEATHLQAALRPHALLNCWQLTRGQHAVQGQCLVRSALLCHSHTTGRFTVLLAWQARAHSWLHRCRSDAGSLQHSTAMSAASQDDHSHPAHVAIVIAFDWPGAVCVVGVEGGACAAPAKI
jgi:hypothetical protein